MARSRLSTGATGMSSHPSERSEEDFFQVSSSVPPALASQVPETMEAQPEAQPEAARPYLRRRSTLADVVAKNFTQATRTNMKRHLQAAVSVAFDTHLDVDTTEDDVKFNLSDATKRLLGPLGQMRIFDKSKKAFETFRSHRLRYHTMHYTFWSNFALAFCLGFWIAMIGLPNYALTVRRFIYGDTERTRDLLIASTLSWDHYWCDFSESGLSALEIANVTDCGAHQTELQMADFESQSFLSEFLRQGSSSRKTCGYNAGRIYMKPYKRFWIGSAAGNYFPVIDGNHPVFIHEINATSVADPILVDGGARCLIMCESSPNCAVWSWRSYTDSNNYGGICHFFTSKAELDKRMMYDVPRWVGGTCQSNAKTDYFCPKNVYGRYYNHAAITEPPDLRHRNLFSATSSSVELWCGILPESWAATWPNVVQMVVFTVFGGTGTTLQLAWQGFVGTSCACLNAFVMSMLFPHGGKAELCTELQMAAGACKAGELIFSSPGYSPFFGWLDILGILFLFLFSNSQMNTIKFGMSWHFFFMMDFINPKTGRKDCPNDTLFYGTICGSEYWFEVFVTTTLGCFFSVLITFIPFPLLNQRKAYSEMSTVGRTVSDIWRESVVYICGSRQTPQRYRIEAKIDAIAEQEMTMRSNLEIAWWESALLCRYDPRRQELLVIQENLQDIFDVLPAVKWCVLNEDFGGEHRGFIGDLQPHLQALVVEATELLELCIRAPYAKGEERRGMNNYIQESAIFVHRLQNFLVEAYRKKHLRLNADLADETTLILSVSFMARKAADLSQVLQEEQAACTCWQRNNMKLLAQGCWQGFKNTWSPALLLARPHLLFAVRNFLGIAAVFFLSIVLQNYIFTNYSPVMPATLALLISRYQNSAFTNNLHRLLGVLLGQVIPLLILSGLSLMHCGHTRWLVSFFSIWTYITFFAYMYFTSSTWSLVGCLVAGFGVYPLLQPCINPSLSDDVLSNKYAELAQIAMALAVQMAVDFLLTRYGPADLAVNELARLLQCIFVGCEEHISGLEAIYKSSLPELQHALKEAELAMHRARSLCSEADPKQRIMLGLYTPFNIGLYRSALDIIQGCMTCLNLVIVCEKTWEVNQSVRDQDEEENPNRKSFEDLEAVPAYSDADLHSMLKIAMESLEKIQKSFTPERILETARHISYSLETILRHRIEVKLEDELVSTLHEIDLLDEHFNMEELDRWLSEVSERTSDIRTDKHELTNNLQARLVVGARAIAQLHFRLAELHSLCLKSSLV